MSADTQKYSEEYDREVRHSALEEFGRDERRPAVLLLGALVIAAIFFALGIMVGRWMNKPAVPTSAPTSAPTNQQRQTIPVNRATTTPSPTPSPTPSTSTTRPATRPTNRR
jgi:cytoskeletal protein RodZ